MEGRFQESSDQRVPTRQVATRSAPRRAQQHGHAFLYSLNTAAITTQAVLRSTAISLTTARSGRSIKATGKVAVKDGNGIAVSGATTFVTWNVPSGGTITQTATTNTKGLAAFTVTDLRGSYTLTVTNLTKTGYTFDPANSVLTKTVISK